MPTDPELEQLRRLVGSWSTEATHPALPGVVVRGTSTMEWLEGERFLIQRTRFEHPEFPDSLWMIGHAKHDRVDEATGALPLDDDDGSLRMHYYDSRGVFRVYVASVDAEAWRLQRLATGFSQRFIGTFAEGGDRIDGLWQMSKDGAQWTDDLAITYRRMVARGD